MEPASGIAIGLSLARTATDLLDGDPLGATIAGNREILLGINDRLKHNENAQRWIQRTLLEMPAELSETFDENQRKELITKLRVRLLELKDHEQLFESSANFGLKDAWRKHHQRLVTLQNDLRKILRRLKLDDHPMLMPARAAAYGMLLQVQGQVIAIERMMLSLHEEVAHQMGFEDPVEMRSIRYDLKRARRITLAEEAYDVVTKFLEETLLLEFSNEISKLQRWHRRNGVLDDWFPRWIREPPPSSNAPINAMINNVARLLKQHCPYATNVADARAQLNTLVYRLGEPEQDSTKERAYKWANRTEAECKLDEGQLTRLRFISFLPERQAIGGGDSTLQFRTPIYSNVLKSRIGQIFPHKPNMYEIESRQYEVAVRETKIPRIVAESDARERWGPHPTRLPGLDMVEFWTAQEKTLKENRWKILQAEMGRRFVYYGSRSAFWWETPEGFQVAYLDVRDLRSKGRARDRFIKYTPRFTMGNETCFVSLYSPPSTLTEYIENERTKVNDTMELLPKQVLVPRGGTCGIWDLVGTPWIRTGPVEARNRSGQDEVNDPESWADVTNQHMSKIEFLLRVQAEIERSYVTFRDFLYRLKGGEEPELGHVIHPGAAAALVVEGMTTGRTDKIVELLTLAEQSEETDAGIRTVIRETDRLIKDEQEKAAFASSLRLGLAVAELTYEYAAPSGPERDSTQPAEDVEMIEIDVEDLDDQRIDALLDQFTAPNKAQQSSKKPLLYDPGLVTHTPILDLVGGLGVGKIGVATIKSGRRIVGKLWFKRKAKREIGVLFDSLQKQMVLNKSGEAVVSIKTVAATASNKVNRAMKALEQASKNKEPFLEFQEKLSFREVYDMGKKFLCSGSAKCWARFRRPDYNGVLLRNGLRQFRVGMKKGSKSGKFQANFENLAKGNRSNVHYTITRP